MRNSNKSLAALAISVQVLTAGCGGGGLASLFSGGDVGEIFGSFFGGDSGSGSGSSGGLDIVTAGLTGGLTDLVTGDSDGDVGGSSGDEIALLEAPSIATVHNPEPASVALFGAGLAGVILSRRRRTRRGGRSSAAR